MGSEIDNEELYTEQELQDLLEDVANDEEETEIADEIAQSIIIFRTSLGSRTMSPSLVKERISKNCLVPKLKEQLQ